jgi:hypothetical protein
MTRAAGDYDSLRQAFGKKISSNWRAAKRSVIPAT